MAHQLDLDFIPLATERFDLIIPQASFASKTVKALRQVLGNDEFKANMEQMGGYDARETGKTVFESD